LELRLFEYDNATPTENSYEKDLRADVWSNVEAMLCVKIENRRKMMEKRKRTTISGRKNHKHNGCSRFSRYLYRAASGEEVAHGASE
jgi:hypothetical protein